MIEIAGYTQEEKVEIAMQHLILKQLEQHGLVLDQLRIPPQIISVIGQDEIVKSIIVVILTVDSLFHAAASYTREAGVRNLERMVGSVCRAVAVKVCYIHCDKHNYCEVISI